MLCASLAAIFFCHFLPFGLLLELLTVALLPLLELLIVALLPLFGLVLASQASRLLGKCTVCRLQQAIVTCAVYMLLEKMAAV